MTARKGKRDWSAIKQQAQEARSAAAEIAALKDRANEVRRELDTTSGTVSGLTSRAGTLETSVETAERTMQDVGDRPVEVKASVETAERTMEEVGNKPATLKSQVETAERTMQDVGDRPVEVKASVEAAERTMEEVGNKPATIQSQVEAAEATMQDVGDRPATLKTDLETAEATMQDVGDRPETVKTNLERAEGLVGEVRVRRLEKNITEAEGLTDKTRVATLRANMEKTETLLDKLAKPDEEEGELEVDDPSDPMQLLNAKLERVFRKVPDALSLIRELVDRTVTAKVYAAAKRMREFADSAVRRDEDIGEALEEFLDTSGAKTSVENAAYEDDDDKLLAALASATARFGFETLISHATDLSQETDPNAQERRRKRIAKLCTILGDESWKTAILEGAAREIADDLISDGSIYEDPEELESAVQDTFSKVDMATGKCVGQELKRISQEDPDETRRERAGSIIKAMGG